MVDTMVPKLLVPMDQRNLTIGVGKFWQAKGLFLVRALPSRLIAKQVRQSGSGGVLIMRGYFDCAKRMFYLDHVLTIKKWRLQMMHFHLAVFYSNRKSI